MRWPVESVISLVLFWVGFGEVGDALDHNRDDYLGDPLCQCFYVPPDHSYAAACLVKGGGPVSSTTSVAGA